MSVLFSCLIPQRLFSPPFAFYFKEDKLCLKLLNAMHGVIKMWDFVTFKCVFKICFTFYICCSSVMLQSFLLQLHFTTPKLPLLLDYTLSSPFYFSPLSGMTHVHSHWDLFLVRYAEINLNTLGFDLRVTHSGERILYNSMFFMGGFICFYSLGILSNQFIELF